jgi:hypothetical protein
MSGMLLLLALTTALTVQQGHFAAPNGTRSGDGTERRPWDLATALAGGGPAKKVQPGDTIWVRGGTYKGAFRSTVAGREGAPVVIRVLPGERAVIDGAGSRRSTLYVTGAYSTFWGLELTNSNPERTTTQLGSDFRPNVVVPAAAHTRFINLIVHDGGVAFYTEPRFADVEIAGCIIYNNGWEGPDRGHGHALYLKSFTGPLLARDNVMFNQYGYGVHAYTNSGTGKLINITIEGNIAFNNGSLSSARDLAPNLLLGGADYAAGNVVRNNILYYSPALRTAGTNAMIGWKTLRNGDVIVENNYLVGGSPMVEFGFWSAARVSNNTLIRTGAGERAPIVRRDAAARGQIWRDNEGRGPAEPVRAGTRARGGVQLGQRPGGRRRCERRAGARRSLRGAQRAGPVWRAGHERDGVGLSDHDSAEWRRAAGSSRPRVVARAAHRTCVRRLPDYEALNRSGIRERYTSRSRAVSVPSSRPGGIT